MQHSSGNKKAEEDANKEAEQKVEGIKNTGSDKANKVVDDLLSAVTNVQAVPPSKA